MYKINKPNFKNEKFYSPIPNAVFQLRNITVYQKHLLMYLFTHKDGFELKVQFIQNALGWSNWITVKKHLDALQELKYITINEDGQLDINLDLINTNAISTNSNTTNTVSTNPVKKTTNHVSTDTTNPVSNTPNPVSTNYSLDEDKTPNPVSTNNNNKAIKQEEKQQEKQKEQNNGFSSKFPLGDDEVKILNEFYQNFISQSEDNIQLSYSQYEDILLLVLFGDRRNKYEKDNTIQLIEKCSDFGKCLHEYSKHMEEINFQFINKYYKDVNNNPQEKESLAYLVQVISANE